MIFNDGSSIADFAEFYDDEISLHGYELEGKTKEEAIDYFVKKKTIEIM